MRKLLLWIGLLTFAGAAAGGGRTFAPHASGADETGLFPIYERGQVGYIDRTGKFVIEPQFDAEGYFRNGLASQTIRPYSPNAPGQWGYIDRTGRFVWKSGD